MLTRLTTFSLVLFVSICAFVQAQVYNALPADSPTAAAYFTSGLLNLNLEFFVSANNVAATLAKYPTFTPRYVSVDYGLVNLSLDTSKCFVAVGSAWPFTLYSMNSVLLGAYGELPANMNGLRSLDRISVYCGSTSISLLPPNFTIVLFDSVTGASIRFASSATNRVTDATLLDASAVLMTQFDVSAVSNVDAARLLATDTIRGGSASALVTGEVTVAADLKSILTVYARDMPNSRALALAAQASIAFSVDAGIATDAGARVLSLAAPSVTSIAYKCLVNGSPVTCAANLAQCPTVQCVRGLNGAIADTEDFVCRTFLSAQTPWREAIGSCTYLWRCLTGATAAACASGTHTKCAQTTCGVYKSVWAVADDAARFACVARSAPTTVVDAANCAAAPKPSLRAIAGAAAFDTCTVSTGCSAGLTLSAPWLFDLNAELRYSYAAPSNAVAAGRKYGFVYEFQDIVSSIFASTVDFCLMPLIRSSATPCRLLDGRILIAVVDGVSIQAGFTPTVALPLGFFNTAVANWAKPTIRATVLELGNVFAGTTVLATSAFTAVDAIVNNVVGNIKQNYYPTAAVDADRTTGTFVIDAAFPAALPIVSALKIFNKLTLKTTVDASIDLNGRSCELYSAVDATLAFWPWFPKTTATGAGANNNAAPLLFNTNDALRKSTMARFTLACVGVTLKTGLTPQNVKLLLEDSTNLSINLAAAVDATVAFPTTPLTDQVYSFTIVRGNGAVVVGTEAQIKAAMGFVDAALAAQVKVRGAGTATVTVHILVPKASAWKAASLTKAALEQSLKTLFDITQHVITPLTPTNMGTWFCRDDPTGVAAYVPCNGGCGVKDLKCAVLPGDVGFADPFAACAFANNGRVTPGYASCAPAISNLGATLTEAANVATLLVTFDANADFRDLTAQYTFTATLPSQLDLTGLTATNVLGGACTVSSPSNTITCSLGVSNVLLKTLSVIIPRQLPWLKDAALSNIDIKTSAGVSIYDPVSPRLIKLGDAGKIKYALTQSLTELSARLVKSASGTGSQLSILFGSVGAALTTLATPYDEIELEFSAGALNLAAVTKCTLVSNGVSVNSLWPTASAARVVERVAPTVVSPKKLRFNAGSITDRTLLNAYFITCDLNVVPTGSVTDTVAVRFINAASNSALDMVKGASAAAAAFTANLNLPGAVSAVDEVIDYSLAYTSAAVLTAAEETAAAAKIIGASDPLKLKSKVSQAVVSGVNTLRARIQVPSTLYGLVSFLRLDNNADHPAVFDALAALIASAHAAGDAALSFVSYKVSKAGQWLCADPATVGGVVACAVAPPGCGNAYQGDVVCSVDRVITPFACDFIEAFPAPVAQTNLCQPMINKLEMAYDEVEGKFNVLFDAVQLLASPSLVFTLKASASGAFDWSAPACTGATCAAAVDGSVTVSLASVTKGSAFIVPSRPLRWFDANCLSITVSASLAGRTTNIISPLLSKTYTITKALLKFATKSVVPVVNFVAAQAAQPTKGSLLVSLEDHTATALATLANGVSGTINKIRLTLPPNGVVQLGSKVDVRVRRPGSPDWYPALSAEAGATVNPATGEVTLTAGPSVGDVLGLHLVFSEAVVDDVADAAGAVGVAVEGAARSFLATAANPGQLTYSRASASDSSRYASYGMAAPTESRDGPALSTALKTTILGNSVANPGLSLSVQKSDTTVAPYSVTVGLSGASKVLEPVLATPAAATSLATNVISTATTEGVTHAYSFVANTLQTGVVGLWKCETAPGVFHDGKCALSIPGCSDTVVGTVKCVAANGLDVLADIACIDLKPVTSYDFGACKPTLSLTTSYDQATSRLTVNYVIDGPHFHLKPSMEFTLKVSSASQAGEIVDWASPQCTAPASLLPTLAGCSYTAGTRTLKVTVNDIYADGSFSVVSPRVRWYRDAAVDIDVTKVGETVSVVQPSSPKSFALPPNFNYFAAAPSVSASFASDVATPAFGMLIMRVYNATGPLAAAAPAAGAAKVTVSAPAGWTFGGACVLASYVNPSDSWLPLATQTSASVAGTTLTLAAPAAIGSLSGVYIMCAEVAPTAAAPAAGATVSASFEGADASFFVAVSTTGTVAVDADNASNVSLFTRFTASTSGFDDATPAQTLKTALFGDSASAIAFAYTVPSADVAVVDIGVAGMFRAFMPYFSPAAALASGLDVLTRSGAALGTWSLGAQSIVTGVVGAYKCRRGVATFEPCAQVPSATCTNSFQGPVVCVSKGLLNTDACGLVTDPVPAPATVTTGCVPAVTMLTPSFDADVVTVHYDVDPAQFLATPTLVFSVAISVEDFFGWAATAPVCVGGTCVYDAASKSVRVTVANVAASGSFTIESPRQRWAKAPVLSADAFLASDLATSVLVGAAPAVTLADYQVDALAAATVAASYAAGTLVVAVSGGAAALDAARAADAATVTLTLPAGWTLGAQCSALSRADGGSSWPLLATPVAASAVTAAGVVTVAVDLDTAVDFTLICSGVTPAVVANGAVSVAFEGAAHAFLAEVVAKGSLTFVDNASADAPTFVRFDATIAGFTPPADAAAVEALLERIVGAAAASQFDLAVTSLGGDDYDVTIGVPAAFAAYTPLLASEAALASLAAALTTAGAETWTYTATSAVSGVRGEWLCSRDGVAYEPCALYPPKCSSVFQGTPTCRAAGATNAAACALDAVPTPGSDTTGCTPMVSDASVAFDSNTNKVTATFKLVDNSYVGNPIVVFSIKATDGLFDWSTPSCAGCTYDSSSASVQLEYTPKPTGFGEDPVTIELDAEPLRWFDAAQISISAAADDHSIVQLGVDLSKLTASLTKVLVTEKSSPVTAAFARGAAGADATGTLIIDLVPAATVGAAGQTAVSVVSVELPAGWSYTSASSASVYSRQAGDSAWFFDAFAPVDSTGRTGSAFTFATSPFDPSLTTVLQIVLTGVTAAPQQDTVAGALKLTFEGPGHAYLIRELAGTLSYTQEALPIAPMYVTFNLARATFDLSFDSEVFAETLFGTSAPMGYEFAVVVDETAPSALYTVVVGLAGADRVYATRFAPAAARAALADDVLGGDWNGGSVAGSYATGKYGEWRCNNAECKIVPEGCGVDFGAGVTPQCFESGSVVSDLACSFTENPKPVPAAVSGNCVPQLSSVTPAVYSAGAATLTVPFKIAAGQFIGTPSITIVVSTSIGDTQTGIFDWAPLTTCGANVCTGSADGSTVSVVVPAVAADGTVTIPVSPVRWADSPTLAFDAYLTADAAKKSILATGATRTQTLAAAKFLMSEITAADVVFTASFVGTSTADNTGAFTLDLKAKDAAIGEPAAALKTVAVAAPAGWALGAACKALVFTQGNNQWPYSDEGVEFDAVSVAADGTVTFDAGLPNLDAIARLVLSFPAAVAARADPAADPIGLSFTGGANAYFAAVTVSAPVASTPAANADAQFLSFVLSCPDVSCGVDGLKARIFAAPGSAPAADADFRVVKSGGEYTVTIGFAGAARAALALLDADSLVALADLLTNDAAAAGQQSWTYQADSRATGPQGAWLCADGAGYTDCKRTPLTCGNKYQGAVACVAHGAAVAAVACGLVAPPGPAGSDYSGCDLSLSAATAVYDGSSALTVTFTVADAAQFVGRPTLEFRLTTSQEGLFGWADETCDGDCAYDAASKALVFEFGGADGAAGDSWFTVDAAVQRWAKDATLSLTVNQAGKPDVVLFSTASTAGAAPYTLGTFNVDTISVAPTASLVMASPPATTGTLLVQLSSIGSMSLSSGPYTTVNVALPEDWALGADCSVRTRVADGNKWVFAQAVVASTSVAGGVITLPAGAALSAARDIVIACEGVTPDYVTASGDITLSFEGPASSYRTEVTAPASVTYTPLTAANADKFVQFKVSSLTGAANDIDDAALFGSEDPIPFVVTKAGSEFTVTIALEDDNLQFLSLLSAPESVAELANKVLTQGADTWSFVAGSLKTGVQGAWQCTDGMGGFAACKLSPEHCAVDWSGTPTCVSEGVAKDYACALVGPAPVATPDTDGCAPLFASVTPTLADGKITVVYTIAADKLDQFIGKPDVTVTLTVSDPSPFDWATGPIACSASQCSYDSATRTVTALLTDVTASGSFTIDAVAEAWAKDVSLTVAVAVGATDVLSGDAPTSFPAGDVLVDSITGATVTVAFAPAAAPATTGTLIVSVASSSGAALSARGDYDTITLSLPAGWALGSDCSIYTRATTGGAWLFTGAAAVAEASVAAGGVLTVTSGAVDFDTAREVHIVCEDTTFAAAAPTVNGAVTVAFADAAGGFLAEVAAAGSLSFDAAAADDTAKFVQITLTGVNAPTPLSNADMANLIFGNPSPFAVGVQRDTVAGKDTFVVTVNLEGGDRAFIDLLSRPNAVADLVAVMTAAAGGAVTWSAGSSAAASGTQGVWQCVGDRGRFEPCALTPAGCSRGFQSPEPVCLVGLHDIDDTEAACSFDAKPVPEPNYDSCTPRLTSVTLAHDESTMAVVVSYTVDAPHFIGEPTLVFTIDSTVIDVYCGAPVAGVTCTFDLMTGHLEVTVAGVHADGSLAFTSSGYGSSRGSTVTVNAAVDTAPATSIMPAGAALTFDLDPVLLTLATTMTATFSQDGPSAATGTLVISLGEADAVTGLAKGTAKVGQVGLSLPLGWALGDVCHIHARGPNDNGWPLSITPVTATVQGRILSASLDKSISQIANVYIVCEGVTPKPVDHGRVIVSFEGVGTSYAAEQTSYVLTYPASGGQGAASMDARYVGFEMILSSATAAVAVADIQALVLNALPGASFAPLDREGKSLKIVLGFAGASRAYADVLGNNDAMEELSLLLAGTPAGVTWVYNHDSVETGFQGDYLCSTGSATAPRFATCKVANDCGDEFSAPVTCVYADADTHSEFACAFDTVPEPEPISSGCGAWSCKDAAGAFVACNDAAVCIDGCETAVATASHLNDARLKQFCTRTVAGALAAADAAAFCPASQVAAAAYAATCNAVTTCKRSCKASGAVAKSCESDLTWNACDATCGAGTQSRRTYCSAADLAINTALVNGNSVAGDVCPAAKTLASPFTASRTCFGAGCAAYEWRCMVAGAPVACTDAATGADVGYSGCSGACGKSVQSRTVVCASIDNAATGHVVTTDTDPLLCAARARKPASTKACESADCANVAWMCYPAGGDPSKPVSCANDGAHSCPVVGCVGVTTSARKVGCYDTATLARAPDAKCLAAKPDLTKQCAGVYDSCLVDWNGAACNVHSGDGPVKTCVDVAGPSGVSQDGSCVTPAGDAISTCPVSVTRRECVLPVCATAPDTVVFEYKSTVGNCVPGCQPYKPVKVECMAKTGSAAAISVDLSFCASLGPSAKPAAWQACDFSECQNGGECLVTPVVLGGRRFSTIYGKCDCAPGFGGALCEYAAALESVTADVAAGRIHWRFLNGDASVLPFVTLSFKLAADSEYTTLATVPADSGYDAASGSSAYTFDFSTLPPGEYTLQATAGAGAKETVIDSDPFVVEAVCKADGYCLNGGSCDESTGLCNCGATDFSGDRCEIKPCATKACNALTSSCDVNPDDTATCVCATGFAGPSCNALAAGVTCARDATEGTCLNGSVRQVHLQAGAPACGACACTGNWAGARCDTCALQCQNGGKPVNGCTACECPAGYHGATCGGRNAVLTVNFVAATPAPAPFVALAAPTDAAGLAAWTARLEASLNALLARSGADPSIKVKSMSNRVVEDIHDAGYVQSKFAVGALDSDGPAAAVAMFGTYDALRKVKPAFAGTSATNPSSPLYASPAFEGLYLGRGVGMKDPNCDAAASETECPVGTLNEAELEETEKPVDPEEPEEPEDPEQASGGLSTNDKIAIGVGVGVGSLFLLLLIILIAWFAGCWFFASKKNKKDGITEDEGAGDVEMAPHPDDV